MTKQEIFKLPFNIERHNANFINYCEVVIYEDGKVEYAVPSHQEKMFEVYAKKHDMTIQEVKELFWNDIDFFDKILDDTGLVLVWYDRLKFTKINNLQIEILNMLKKYGCIAKGIVDLRKEDMIYLVGRKDTVIILDKDRKYKFDCANNLFEEVVSRNIDIKEI